MKATCGFTLTEVLIVVALLGILAAIVIPQFSSATMDGQTSALKCNLQVVRKQIELYRQQHNSALPVAVGEEEADFVRRMTTKTDNEGAPGSDYGPYMERVPINPFNRRNAVRIGDAAAGANTHGWRFDPATGRFQADDNYDADADGTPDHVNL